MGLWGICWDLIRLRLLLKKGTHPCFVSHTGPEKSIVTLFCFPTRFTFFSAMEFMFNIQIEGLFAHNQWKKFPFSTVLESSVWVHLVYLRDCFSCSFLSVRQYDLLKLFSLENFQDLHGFVQTVLWQIESMFSCIYSVTDHGWCWFCCGRGNILE